MVTATPGYINLGMNTTIGVIAPAAGTYSLKVQEPNGAETSVNFTFAAAGQTVKATFGVSNSSFDAVVNQVGTYNVFLVQGGQVVSSTSFYATNQLVVTMDMVTGGTCAFVQGVTRGEALIPRFTMLYASNDVKLTNDTKGASVNFTMPGGQVGTTSWDPNALIFGGYVADNWNYSYVGSWNPTANASDAAGNVGTFKYTGSPFVITPAQLSTNVTLLSTSTGSVLTSLANGQGLTINATITYPTNAEPVSGFVAPLSPSRGGSVTAQVGWGFYNATSGTFGGGKTTGTLIGTVLMAYSGKNGTWTGQFQSTSLPTLPVGDTYEVVVSSKDGTSPTNTGLAIAELAPTAAGSSSTTLTSTAVSTLLSTTTQTVVQTVQAIPTIVYAALAILLILGVVIGYIVKVPR
ncbi:MAG: hypothetical protein OK442_03710 [Thaumarchaeota archaeon]|nr:hypothetical protein [Nitrososphaerota archaeon]